MNKETESGLGGIGGAEYSSYLSKAEELEAIIRNQEVILRGAQQLLEAAENQLLFLEGQKPQGGRKLEGQIENCANLIFKLNESIKKLHTIYVSTVESKENFIDVYRATREFLEEFNPPIIQ